MAIVLTFDGAVGSVAEVIDGVYTGREGGPFNYREGKAQAIRDLAEREEIDLAASWAYSDSGVRPADAAGSSGIRWRSTRTRNWAVSHARRGGRSCASSNSVASCASPRPPRS